MLVQPKKFHFSILLALLLSLTAAYADWPDGDLDGDYKVDRNDFYLFAQQWLDTSGCSGNGCADFDGVDGVDFKDFAILAGHWMQEYYNAPPTPNPATWATVPYATGIDTVSMTATTGTDDTGPVEYYFNETSSNPGGNDSTWQTIPTYTDTGLSPNTQYTYTVQMRDALHNTGTISSPASATTATDYELFINEFMASNGTTHEDPDEAGETPDWIEIYNDSDSTISLA
jgi:hypothetical protein